MERMVSTPHSRKWRVRMPLTPSSPICRGGEDTTFVEECGTFLGGR